MIVCQLLTVVPGCDKITHKGEVGRLPVPGSWTESLEAGSPCSGETGSLERKPVEWKQDHLLRRLSSVFNKLHPEADRKQWAAGKDGEGVLPSVEISPKGHPMPHPSTGKSVPTMFQKTENSSWVSTEAPAQGGNAERWEVKPARGEPTEQSLAQAPGPGPQG